MIKTRRKKKKKTRDPDVCVFIITGEKKLPSTGF